MAPLLEFKSVARTYPSKQGPLQVIRDVNFTLEPGGILALVGESGCGKTTTGKIAAGLVTASSGQVLFKGDDISALKGTGLTRLRRSVQLIHQDPYSSLNPVRTVFQTLAAPLQRFRLVKSRKELLEKVRELLLLVDLTPPDDFLFKYPHQLSGGQRQRVAVARALTVNPEFIVADESVSMVDVSIRTGLLNMLLRLNQELGVAFLFITHDLAVARYFSWQGRAAVMYLGRIVEFGPTPDVTRHPTHPYTQALVASLPVANPRLAREQAEDDDLGSPDVPSLHNLPSGCAFHPRCPLHVTGTCEREVPVLESVGEQRSEHEVACPVVLRTGREVS